MSQYVRKAGFAYVQELQVYLKLHLFLKNSFLWNNSFHSVALISYFGVKPLLGCTEFTYVIRPLMVLDYWHKAFGIKMKQAFLTSCGPSSHKPETGVQRVMMRYLGFSLPQCINTMNRLLGATISEQMALWFPAVIAGMGFRVEWVNSEILDCFWQAASVLG